MDLNEKVIAIDGWKRNVKDANGVVIGTEPIKVLVRELSVGSRLDVFNDPKNMTFDGRTDMKKATPLIVIASVFDPVTKEPVFKDSPEDIKLIRGKAQAAIKQIVEAALEMNAVEEGSQEAAKNE